MSRTLAQGSSWLPVKHVSGEARRAAGIIFAAWMCRGRALEISSGGQILGDLAVAISRVVVVGMAKSSAVTPAVPGRRAGGSCWGPCPCPEAAGAGVLALQGFPHGSALHLTLSLPWQESLSSILTGLN